MNVSTQAGGRRGGRGNKRGNPKGALLYMVPMYVREPSRMLEHPGCFASLRLRGKACYCITYFSLDAAKECSRKKRPMDAPPKNLPTTRPGGFEFYRVWGFGPNKFFVSGRPLAPLANFANGGPHSLLAADFGALQALLAMEHFIIFIALCLPKA